MNPITAAAGSAFYGENAAMIILLAVAATIASSVKMANVRGKFVILRLGNYSASEAQAFFSSSLFLTASWP